MEEIYRKNEAETNEFVARAIRWVLLFVLLFGILCWVRIFDIFSYMINGFILSSLFPLVLPTILVNCFHISRRWVKYVLILCIVVVTGDAYAFFTFQTVLVFIIPSILAAFYLSKKVMAFTGAASVAAIAVSHLITAFHLFQPWIEPFQGLGPIMLYGALPRILQYLCCMLLLYLLSARYSGFFRSFYSVLSEKRENGASEGFRSAQTELNTITGLLTEREREVFELMANGLTNTQIAERLCIANGTVKNYVSAVYDKTEIRDRTVLILKFSPYYRSHD